MNQNNNISPNNQNGDLNFEPYSNQFISPYPFSGVYAPNFNVPAYSTPSTQYMQAGFNPYEDLPYNSSPSINPVNEDMLPPTEPLFLNQYNMQPESTDSYESGDNNLRLPPLYWFTPLFNYYQPPHLIHNHGFYPYPPITNIPYQHHHYNDYDYDEDKEYHEDEDHYEDKDHYEDHGHYGRGINDASYRIETENQEVFKTFEYYNIPYPVAKSLVDKIVSLTLDYTK